MDSLRKALPLLLVCLVGLAVAAISNGDVVGQRQTQIISPPGGSPSSDGPSDAAPGQAILPFTIDGTRAGSSTPTTDPIVNRARPADNVEFSQDNRVVKYVAYDSAANNLVDGSPGDGHSHIYLLTRNGMGGTLNRVDPNAGGDSIKPSLDGQTKTGNGSVVPHCVVFQSTSQLTKDDTSGNWSIYLYDISTKKLTLISAPGATARDGVVDGTCDTVTYESGGKVYVHSIAKGLTAKIATGFNPDQETDGKGVAYDRDGQVYYQAFEQKSVKYKSGKRKGKHHLVLRARGSEVLVSVNPDGKPGNGNSEMPSANDNGTYIAFESTATDLCDGSKPWCGTRDANGPIMDVFRRTQPASVTGHTPPTDDQMEMIDYDSRLENPPFQSDLESDQVKISGAGEQACFRSFGVLTRQKKFGVAPLTGPYMHIYFWNFPREKMSGAFTGESREGVSKDTEFKRDDSSAAFNWSCGISNRGTFIAWSSDDEHQAGETNGRAISDLFLRFMGASDEGLGGNLG
jgi:hypothetical protein